MISSTLRNSFFLALALVVSLPAVLGCTNAVDLACSLPEFSTLCSAIELAGLGDALDMGNWTVFAPTNDAFAALPEDVLDAALNSTVMLADILLFHAVPEVLSASMLECTELVEMANGKDSRTVCADDVIYQKGGGNDRLLMPKIVTTDIETCQGFVHVIDDIIMLPALLATQ